jgi:putative acyl-CoA dehydrogenase
MSGYATHEVLNQPGELTGYNVFGTDQALRDAIGVFGAGWAEQKLVAVGARAGSAHVQNLARAANRFVPELRTHDRFGNRIDMVEFHPAWHELMGMLRADQVHALGWTETRPGAHIARAALAYLWTQAEAGIGCPAVMTFASIAALAHEPDLLAEFRDKILSPGYDPRPLPPAEKTAIGVAMAMTEKQGGSDLRSTHTTAVPISGGKFALTGHKWFFSVPTSDLFLTLARTEAGISCFLAQGWRDDGSRNQLLLQRLKEKCGNRSNASSEVEFRGLEAVMVGAEGRGIATILEMAHLTRIECATGSAALMRQAVSQAIHHAGHRSAFQRRLVDQPIMANVLADLAIEAEGAMWLALRAAAALDASAQNSSERALSRILAPIAKYYVCKRAPEVIAEAVECHGGNGFIEDHVMARLYREAPLNGLWEGSGNVICLDVLRAIGKEPEATPALLAELARARGEHPAFDQACDDLQTTLAGPIPEAGARRLVETMALALTGGLLLRHAPRAVADAFCASRLAGDHGRALGTLPAGTAFHDIITRAAPAA